MAKYKFICDLCGEVVDKITSPRLLSAVCPKCTGNMSRQLPTMNGPVTVYEDPDGQSGKKWLPDHQETIKARRLKYYYEVEVPRLVASGIYSIETMLDNDWIWLDDNGQIHVHTKPPEMR